MLSFSNYPNEPTTSGHRAHDGGTYRPVLQVEVAYNLLVEKALAGEENAMDEFADQCRIITERFEEEAAELAELAADDDDEEYVVEFEEDDESPRGYRNRRRS
jgi:hypothetical protein